MSHLSIDCYEEVKGKLQKRVRFLLGLAVVLQCLFPLYSWLRGEDTIFFKYLTEVCIGDNSKAYCSESILLLDRGLFVCLILSTWEVLRGGKNRIFLSFIFVWFLCVALLARHFDNQPPYSGYSVLNQGMRYLGVLAAILIWGSRWCEKEENEVGKLGGFWVWVLRFGVAMTFIGHGLAAYWGKPEHVDLVIGSLQRLPESWRVLDEGGIMNFVLKPTGVIDIVFGAMMLLPGRRFWGLLKWVSLYLAFWGLVAALSRVVSGGIDQWHAVALRSMYFVGPLCLFLYFRSCIYFNQELNRIELLNREECKA